MKLYKYLLIANELINNTSLFQQILFDQLEGYPIYHYVNKFYQFLPLPDECLMSFAYKNYSTFETAYTIIDESDVDKIVRDIHNNKHHWNSSNDTEGQRQVDKIGATKLLDCLAQEGISTHGQALINQKHKIRTGGYVTSSKLMLHEYLLQMPGSTALRYVHHKGHTFDNRKLYLSIVPVKEHDRIHKDWEPNHNIFRPKKVKIGDFCTPDLLCDCKATDSIITPKNCRNCCAVLALETEQQLKNFVAQITSNEYRKLAGHSIYEI